MPIAARHLMITGRVQGVFYRNWTVATARSLGLTGWVRNRSDGSVEALVEGRREAVEQFVALAHQGPPAARVEQVDSRDVAAEGLQSFDKRSTC